MFIAAFSSRFNNRLHWVQYAAPRTGRGITESMNLASFIMWLPRGWKRKRSLMKATDFIVPWGRFQCRYISEFLQQKHLIWRVVLDDKYRDTPRDVHVPFRGVVLIDEDNASKPCQRLDEFPIRQTPSLVSSRTWMVNVRTNSECDLDINVAVSMSSSCLPLCYLDKFTYEIRKKEIRTNVRLDVHHIHRTC